MPQPEIGGTHVHDFRISGDVLTPLPIRTLFSGAGAVNFDQTTGIIGTTIGSTPGTVAAGNDARFSIPNVIQVKNSNPGAGEFTSIATAVATITNATSSNAWLVEIGPGLFIEPTITVPPYVYLRGSGKIETKIMGVDPSGVCISMGDSTEVCNLTVMRVPTGSPSAPAGTVGILFDSVGSHFPSIIENCLIANCETLVKIHTHVPTPAQIVTYGASLPATPDALFIMISCGFGPSIGAKTGIMVTSDPGTTTGIYLTELFVYDTAPHADNFIYGTGAGTLIVASNIVISMVGTITPGSAAIRISDGAEARLYSGILKSYDTAIVVDNIGAPPILNIFGMGCQSCNRDIEVNHPGTTGICTSYTNQAKTFINKQCSFFVVNRDLNILNVSPHAGDYQSISAAIDSINPIIVSTVTNDGGGNPVLLTSNSLFTVQQDNLSVVGIGIAPGTTCTYVNDSTLLLSQACIAVAGSTVSAQFIRATSTNPFSITLGPGTYNTGALVLPDWVGLNAIASNVIVNQSGSITIGSNCAVNNINFVASNPSVTSIRSDSVSNSVVINCSFQGFSTGALAKSTLSASTIKIVQCYFNTCNIGVNVDGTVANNNIATITCELLECRFNNQNVLTDAYGLQSVGTFAYTTVNQCAFINYPNGTAIFAQDAGTLISSACEIRGVSNGLVIGNAGVIGPVIKISSLTITDASAMDVNILHPNATGVISGIYQRSKAFIHLSSSVVMSYLDPVVAGSSMIGAVYMGATNALSCDVAPHLQKSIAVGLHEGGQLTAGVGLSVSAAAGNGYSSYLGTLQRLTWGDTIVTLTANSQNYICVSTNGVTTQLISALSIPDTTQNILLGRVVTTATDIEIMDLAPVISIYMGNRQEQNSRKTVGSIFPAGGGSLVTAIFQPTEINLAVASGTYYYGQIQFNPSGSAAPLSFAAYSHSSGTWSHTLNNTSLDNNNYDNGTDLVPLPAGNYIKHSLYLVGDGANEKYMLVYGREPCATENLISIAGLPLPPTYFTEGVVLIASIILLQGDVTFCTVQSQRPIHSFVAAGVNGVVTSHSELLDLNADDHLQYLRADGGRTMTGNLNMGNNNITNLHFANGIAIESHASRHLINGADPLTTGDPSILSASSVTAQGSGPGFSLSDHVHQLSMATTGTALIPDQALIATVGTSANLARGDHTHTVQTDVAVSIGSSNTQGSSLTSFSRSDHQHQGIHSLKANNGGTARFGDIALSATGLISITDDGNGTFTFTYPRIPQQLQQRFGSGASGDSNIGIKVPGSTPTMWSVSSNFVYQGSIINSGNISKFGIVYSMANSDTVFSARIFDVTNNNEIATITGLGGVQTQQYVYTSSISNIPANPAVLELQFSRTAGANNALILHCMYFEY